jgi:hypothetical protein
MAGVRWSRGAPTWWARARLALLAVIVLLPAAGSAGEKQTVYIWRDGNGVVRFTPR